MLCYVVFVGVYICAFDIERRGLTARGRVDPLERGAKHRGGADRDCVGYRIAIRQTTKGYDTNDIELYTCF